MILREYGGADRDRTGDPLLAKQVLSQLSYSPLLDCLSLAFAPSETDKALAREVY